MSYWSENIEQVTRRNRDWRRVVYTGHHLQVVLMSVPAGDDLGWEKHTQVDQFFRVEHGTGVLFIHSGDENKPTHTVRLRNGVAAVVPAGWWHNVYNLSSTDPLKFYTIYAPPHHPPNRLDKSHDDERRRHDH